MSVFSSSIAIFSLYVFFNINIEIMQVAISAIGKVHQTILVTLSDNVNKYATGNTNTTSLNNEIINGLIAYPSDCNTPYDPTRIVGSAFAPPSIAFIPAIITDNNACIIAA